MSHCHCGEFDRPTIAPDEFGETCFHERDKCEVPPVLSMQGFIQYLSNGVAWALSNGLTADDLGDDVPESIKDAWDELRDQWDSLAHDADNFMDMLEGGAA